MAKQLTPPDIAAILARGTFDDLRGGLEDEHLECKAAPYQLPHDHQKYELAKDVSAIANRSARTGSDGGYILLGVRTERSPEYHRDVVVDVSPFARALVNPDDYYKVFSAWLLPICEAYQMARTVVWTAVAGCEAIRSATQRAVSCSCAAGTTSWTMPMS